MVITATPSTDQASLVTNYDLEHAVGEGSCISLSGEESRSIGSLHGEGSTSFLERGSRSVGLSGEGDRSQRWDYVWHSIT